MKFILLTSMLFSLSSFANSNYDWDMIYKSTEESNTSKGFDILKLKHPAIFAHYNSSIVDTANVNTYIYQFVGSHSCSVNDSRLRFESKSYGLCETADDQHTGACFQTASPMPSPADPCL